jgi:sterol 3beta-glucosyltransferase
LKIYLVTTGSRGDFEPFYAFAKQASNLGHEVYLSVTEEFINEIKDPNFNVLKLPGTIKQFVDSNGVSYIKNAIDFLPNVRPMLVKILDVISNQIIEIKPDVVLYHPTALTAPIAAKYVKALSVLVEIIPVLSPTKEFASAGLWTSDLKFLNKLTYKGIELAEKLFFLETNKLAKKLQVKNREHDLAISLVSPALLKRPHDWPNNSYVAGPWFQERTEELSPEITEFVERKETIYAGFGSMKKKNPLKLAETIIEACKELNLQLIINRGWGGLELPNQYKNDDSIRYVNGISHTKIFPKVKAIMHHGGVGTVHAALRAGTVSIIVPFIVDQPWWADRLHRLNLGPKALPLRKFTKKNVIERIIETSKYNDNVKEISKLMLQDDGVNVTLDLIQKNLIK